MIRKFFAARFIFFFFFLRLLPCTYYPMHLNAGLMQFHRNQYFPYTPHKFNTLTRVRRSENVRIKVGQTRDISRIIRDSIILEQIS